MPGDTDVTVAANDATARVEVLGRFRVVVVGGRAVDEADWPGRRSAEIVQLLTLSPRRQLLRDEVLESLWPHLAPEAAANNLRKAAHHARQALGDPESVVLRGGVVALFPDRRVEVDVEAFEVAGAFALAAGDPEACAVVADSCGGDLLPTARYEDWAEGRRRSVHALRLELLRSARRWADLVALEPTDEPAHQALMEEALGRGSRAEALRWYAGLRHSLATELGVSPDERSRALHDRCLAAAPGTPGTGCVGRDAELALLERALAEAVDRRGGAIAVRGGAGAGKTTLCRELARRATEAGWACLWTTADRGDQPYAPLVALVDELLLDHRDVLGHLAGNAAAVLGALLPGYPGAAAEGPLSRHQVVGAVQQLVRAVHRGPVVVVVDDAHLADEATIDVAAHLAASVRDVVVVLVRRDAPPNASLARVLARLGRGGRLHELELGPLGDGQADDLLRAIAPDLDEPTRRHLRAEAGGNPFILAELARLTGEDTDAVATVGTAMTARLVDLVEADVDGLRRLALSGGDVDQATALVLLDRTEPELHALLDTTLEAGILTVVGDRYRFVHDLVRAALAAQLPPHRRLEVHRRAAQALGERGAAPAVVARHWLAGERPAEAVAPLLAAAASAMELGAFADARRHVGPVLAHEPLNAHALRLEAEALDMMGDPRTLLAYDTAIAAAGAVETQDLQAMRALAQIKQGDPAGALEAIAGVSPTSVTGRLSEALTYAGAAALGFADPAFGTAKAAESRRIALESGDAAAIVIASWAQAAAAHARGELHDSVITDLRDTAAVPHLAVRVFDGQLCITQRFLYGARPYGDVIAFADALADEGERLGAARGHAFGVTLRGEAELLSGRLDDAEVDLRDGGRLHRAVGAAVGEAHALQRLAEVAIHRGRDREAWALLDEALDLARVTDIGFHLLDRIYGTRITLAGSDPDAAVAAVDEAESAVQGQLETCPGCRITFAVPAAIACATAGELERAVRYEEASAWLAHVVMRLPAWDAAHEEVRGHVRRAAGDAEGARQQFARARDGFDVAGQPLDAARCRALAGAG